MFSVGNSIVWSFLGFFFSRQAEKDDHSGINGVTTHENGLFLYKSKEVNYAGAERFSDYLALGLLGGFFANQWIFILPLTVWSFRMPRQLLHSKYFTYHAELLPHTEQVVFHKTTMFGQINRTYVNVGDLEKIDAEEIDAELLWAINRFDDQLVFRDVLSREVFVFDKAGIWNKDTLAHPLIN